MENYITEVLVCDLCNREFVGEFDPTAHYRCPFCGVYLWHNTDTARGKCESLHQSTDSDSPDR